MINFIRREVNENSEHVTRNLLVSGIIHSLTIALGSAFYESKDLRRFSPLLL